MNRNSINLRKCMIKGLKTDLRSFIAQDLDDNSEKEIFLSGNQRLFYLDYKVGDILYTAKSSSDQWRLIADTDFKRNNLLYTKKLELDKKKPMS